MDRWLKKTAVVTGASSGIGAAIAVALADAGVNVIGLGRRLERVQSLQSKVDDAGIITARICDITNSEEIASTFNWIEQTFGGVHIMINNAGVLYPGGITDATNDPISEDELVKTFDTNVKGTVLCARHAVNSMVKHNINGHVINVNSIAGHYIPMAPHFNVYPSTKHAVTGFTMGILNELSYHRNSTKVTSLSPGLVKTELGGLDELDSSLPSLQPEDVASAVLYVLSTPPHVNIDELTITSVTERRL